MLHFLQVSNSAEIKNILKNYNALNDTWIVSDLKSKQEIQNESVNQHGYFTDDAILRVSDFWRLWLRRLEPTLQVVSSDFIKALVQNFVDTHGSQLDLLDSEVTTLNKALQEFAPILLHPSSDEVLEEWMSQQATEKKWKRWYQVAKICLNKIINVEGALDAKWSAAYLQTLDLKLISWQRKIYVDLGSELSSVEMGLFKHLSQNQDVYIITPEPVWKDKFPYLLNTYNENFGYGSIQKVEAKHIKSELKAEQFFRLSTQLAEVKFAVARARTWADSGINIKNIAIVSADIEPYWPVLDFYLATEGLPPSKDSVSQLNSLGDIQNLLAFMQNNSEEVSWDSLERTFFGSEKSYELKFEKFKSLFYQLYDSDDLNRDDKIKNLFYKKINFNTEFDRDEFLTFMVKSWMQLSQSKNKNNLFEIVFKDLLSQSLNTKMKLSRWMQFLKNRLSHKEVVVTKGTAEGIQILSLMSAQMTAATHKIYIGLNDEFYHKKQKALMSLQDSIELRTQFDLAVDYSEESYLDFNLRWQALSANENNLFTSAHLSFNSDPLNASLYFIENLPRSEISKPAATRVDEQIQRFSDVNNINEKFLTKINVNRLKQDVGGYESIVNSTVFKKLSVSDIENYSQCSFKLLASKGFKLRDYSQIALDLDPREKGSMVHALFEFCINEMQKNQYTTLKVSEFLDQRRSEFNIYQFQDVYWLIQKNKFIQIAEKFYEFEKQRIKTFTVQTEIALDMYFNISKKTFSLENNDGAIHFSVRIDRVDTHKTNKYQLIYDYKSSGYQATNYTKWISDKQFQMLLYITALDLHNSQKSTDEQPVKGALYYQYKKFDLKNGLLDENIGKNEFQFSGRNKSLITFDKLELLKSEFVAQIDSVLGVLSNNVFNNIPDNEEACNKCDWRKLCRANHLM